MCKFCKLCLKKVTTLQLYVEVLSTVTMSHHQMYIPCRLESQALPPGCVSCILLFTSAVVRGTPHQRGTRSLHESALCRGRHLHTFSPPKNTSINFPNLATTVYNYSNYTYFVTIILFQNISEFQSFLQSEDFLEEDVPLDDVLHKKIGKLIKSPSMFHITWFHQPSINPLTFVTFVYIHLSDSNVFPMYPGCSSASRQVFDRHAKWLAISCRPHGDRCDSITDLDISLIFQIITSCSSWANLQPVFSGFETDFWEFVVEYS